MAGKTITIIGAGPTGLSAALALHKRGCSVRILERNNATTNESRAVGVNRASLLHLETVGVLDEILAHSQTVKQVRLFTNGEVTTTLQIPQPKTGPPALIALPQSKTEAILRDSLSRHGVDVEWETEAQEVLAGDMSAIVRAVGPTGPIEISSDFVLGADGSRSVTRKSLTTSFRGHHYEGDWALIDAQVNWPWPDVQAAARLDNGGQVMVMINLGDGRYRIIGTALNLEARVRALMEVGEISWRNEFNLSERCVDRYGEGRIWIAGDAAHVHSPVGGMGMNLGIDDAFDFADTVMSGDFKSFEQRRLKAARRVMRIADIGFRIMTSANPLVKVLRSFALRRIGSSKFFQRRLAGLMFRADKSATDK